MLARSRAIATVAVRDLAAAARFYEGILKLTRTHTEGDGAIEYAAGDTHLLVYVSEHAGGNEATAVTWDVGETLDEVVTSLRVRGVRFERYDMPHVRMEGDVHVAGRMRMAWFKDPDGNIHALMQAT
jgi:catechol 2,3-dioxygenase-like lactoylglutathione lyase family enzyme